MRDGARALARRASAGTTPRARRRPRRWPSTTAASSWPRRAIWRCSTPRAASARATTLPGAGGGPLLAAMGKVVAVGDERRGVDVGAGRPGGARAWRASARRRRRRRRAGRRAHADRRDGGRRAPRRRSTSCAGRRRRARSRRRALAGAAGDARRRRAPARLGADERAGGDGRRLGRRDRRARSSTTHPPPVSADGGAGPARALPHTPLLVDASGHPRLRHRGRRRRRLGRRRRLVAGRPLPSRSERSSCRRLPPPPWPRSAPPRSSPSAAPGRSWPYAAAASRVEAAAAAGRRPSRPPARPSGGSGDGAAPHL